MKQPELGRKILELRKQKGLTQEELVEQCNINVRTIQRIEAGEVTPRSFTLKTILNVLGEDLENLQELETSPFENFNLKEVGFSIFYIKLAWICGIIYFLSGFVEFAVGGKVMEGKQKARLGCRAWEKLDVVAVSQ